jgi:alkylhydroperoxidase/carboxymuconolactone decarboxylase family protein YurZ
MSLLPLAALQLLEKVLGPAMKLLRLTDGKRGVSFGKLYRLNLELDQILREPIDGLDEQIREDIHKMWMARWEYFHINAMTAAYMLDPEFIRLEDFSSDEQDELFEVFVQMQTEKYSSATIKKEFLELRKDLAFMEEHPAEYRGRIDKDAFSAGAQELMAHDWADVYLRKFPALQYVAKRLAAIATSASACERLWSREGAVHTKKRNRLGQERIEHLVRIDTCLRYMESSMTTQVAIAWDTGLEEPLEEEEEE